MKWFSTRDSLTQGTFSLTFPLRDKQKESPRQPTNLIVPNEKSLYFESMDEKKFVFPKNENGSCSGTRVPPFFTSCMRRGFLLMRASFVMLLTTRSDARARKGVSFYLSACRFPVFLYTNCTSVYLV